MQCEGLITQAQRTRQRHIEMFGCMEQPVRGQHKNDESPHPRVLAPPSPTVTSEDGSELDDDHDMRHIDEQDDPDYVDQVEDENESSSGSSTSNDDDNDSSMDDRSNLDILSNHHYSDNSGDDDIGTFNSHATLTDASGLFSFLSITHFRLI